MKASNSDAIDDFIKYSMSENEAYEAPIPDILKDVDDKYQQQKEDRQKVEDGFQKLEQKQQDQRIEQNQQGQEGQQQQRKAIIPPLGIAKPELVDSVMQNMGNDKKILEAIDDAERYEKETPQETIEREVEGHGARALEALIGGVGDVIRMVLPDLEGDEPEEFTGVKPGDFNLRNLFPTTEELRELTKSKTGTRLEPKNKTSKATQEYTQGVVGSLPFLRPLAALGIPLIGQVAKEGVKWSGGTESEGDMAKAGVMTVASIANIGNARGAATQMLNASRDMIPQALQISARPTLTAFNRLRNQSWFRTGSTPSKAPAMQMIERIENSITQNGTLNLHDGMQLRRDLNEARKSLGAFNIPPITDRAAARRYLDMVDDALVSSMERYGTQVNPRWWNTYQMGNQAFAITERTGKLAEVIEKYAKPLQSDMAKVLFHTGGATLAAGAGLGGAVGAISGVAGAGAVLGQGYKIINRMIRSPVIRSHYVEVLNAAASGNAAVLNKALQKFDKVALKHEYPKEKANNQGILREGK